MPAICTFKRCQLLTAFIALVTILCILLTLFVHNYPPFARQRVIDALIFKDGTPSMERFKTTKDLENLRISFYLLNITNAHQVNASGISNVKLDVKEVGPFVYSEYKVRDFIDNDQKSGLITYRLRKQYKFEPSLSYPADPSKLTVTWLNIPLLVTDQRLKTIIFKRVRDTIGGIINRLAQSLGESAFITDTVQNLLFDGSPRPFFEALYRTIASDIIKPWPLPDNRFGILYGRNNQTNTTKDVDLTTSAGFGTNQTYKDLNRYVFVNGTTTSNAWQPKPTKCNIIKGTDGEFFAPFSTDPKEDISVYALDICRELPLSYRENINMYGISTMKYSLNATGFKSGLTISENQCYCLEGPTSRECKLDGLVDLRNCGNPLIYASGANFWASSKELLKDVTGLSDPDPKRHEPVILKEPNTGLALNVKIPIQFNVKLERPILKMFNFIDSSEPIFVPFVWLEETSEMTSEQSVQLKKNLLILDSWFVVMVLGGSIVLVAATFITILTLIVRYRRTRPSTSQVEGPTADVREASETDRLIENAESLPTRTT